MLKKIKGRKSMKGGSPNHLFSKDNRTLIPGTMNYILDFRLDNFSARETFVPAVFTLDGNKVDEFQSAIDAKLTPMDCFINAMQLLGIFDAYTSNVLRISCAGTTGFGENQIEMIFALYAGMKYSETPMFDFLEAGPINVWSPIVMNSLQKPGDTVFCGWRQEGGAHVFIIAKDPPVRRIFFHGESNQSSS